MKSPDLTRLNRVLPLLIDRRTGVVRHVTEVGLQPGAPRFFHYGAEAASTQAFGHEANFSNTGGASIFPEVAQAKAVGEAVERYCAAIYDPGLLTLCSYNENSENCIDPCLFDYFAEEQFEDPKFPWKQFTRSTKVRWAQCRNLVSGQEALVPAAMVYVPYIYYLDTGDTPITQPISTGLACHCSFAEAAIGAICEVVERDAFMLVWQSCECPAGIDQQTLTPELRDIAVRFSRDGDHLVIIDITSDLGVPTTLSLLASDRAERPALCAAASTAVSSEEATRKSLEELAHTHRYMSLIRAGMDPNELISPSEIATQRDHLQFWCAHQNQALASFLFQPELRPFVNRKVEEDANAVKSLQALAARMRSHGHEVFVTDLTTPDIEGLGLKVVRAVIPGLHPLFMGHWIRGMGGKRLLSRLRSVGRGPTEQNHAPHPYP